MQCTWKELKKQNTVAQEIPRTEELEIVGCLKQKVLPMLPCSLGIHLSGGWRQKTELEGPLV